MKVVVRRCRGPVVPIQPRDERRRSARGALDDGPAFEAVPELGDEDEEDVPEVTEDVAAGPATVLPTGAAGTEAEDVTLDTA